MCDGADEIKYFDGVRAGATSSIHRRAWATGTGGGSEILTTHQGKY
jgi:hypothetical protein